MGLYGKRTAPPTEQRSTGWPTSLVPPRVLPNGARVDRNTAPQILAFSAAVHLQASIISTLPIKQYSVTDPTQEIPIRFGSFLSDPGGRRYGWADFIYSVMSEAGYTGNAIGIIDGRDGNGLPRSISLVESQGTDAQTSADGSIQFLIRGKAYDKRDVFHLRRYPRPGRVLGTSPIEQYALTLGHSLAASNYISQWFQDGANPSGILATDQPINQDDARTIKERFTNSLRGNREPVVLGAGLKYTPVQATPADSQLVEFMRMSAAEAARVVGPGYAELLGYATGDSSTYKNREQVAIDLLTYSIEPWLVRIEETLSEMLATEKFIRFDRTAILRSDMVTRFAAYRTAVGPVEPFLTVNEIRERENISDVTWGEGKPVVSNQSVGTDPAPDVPAKD